MTGSGQQIEGSELARALKEDQLQQRQEDQAAMQREEAFVERLAAEMARQSDAPPGF
jgi:hypothetical protein